MTSRGAPRSLVLSALCVLAGCQAKGEEIPAPVGNSERGVDRDDNAASAEEWGRRSPGTAGSLAELTRAGGLEMGTAGYHITRPWTLELHVARGLPEPPEHCVRDWCFWDAQPRYAREYWASETPERAPATVLATVRGVPLARVMVIDVVPEDDTEATTYSLIGHLGERGLDRLRALMAPITREAGSLPSGTEVVDWFGIRRVGPSASTEMRLILVADDRAYCSFSVNDVLASADRNGVTSWSVLLADGLPRGEAMELARRLSRSR